MNPYALIDLHCDTLTDCTHKGLTPDTLDDSDRVLSLNAIPSDVHWHSFMPSSSGSVPRTGRHRLLRNKP